MSGQSGAVSGPGLTSLEEAIGYTFRDRDLLLEALTHKSYHYEHLDEAPVHNERLEFLGDSVLGLSIVSRLFELGGEYSEATMSKIKSYVVKRAVLNEVGSAIGLGQHLRIGKGEEETGGRTKASIIADAFEALIGAVYVEDGFHTARDVVLRLMGERVVQAAETGHYHDYKTELQERSQEMFGMLPEYRLVGQEGLDHEKTFTIEVLIDGTSYGTGAGRNKKEAQQASARVALETLAQKNT